MARRAVFSAVPQYKDCLNNAFRSWAFHGYDRRRDDLSRTESQVCVIALRIQEGASAQPPQLGHCGHIRGSNRPLGVECAALQRAARLAPYTFSHSASANSLVAP